MDAPAHFPRGEADAAAFAEWAVYGDYLQSQGDPRGTIIAHDLALPAVASGEQLAAFHAACAQLPELRETVETVGLGFALGHVRTVTIARPVQLAAVERLLAAPSGRLIEEVRADGYAIDEHDAAWTTLLRRLPAGCRLVLGGGSGVTPNGDAVLRLLADLPSGVRDVAVRGEERLVGAFVSDRFDTVEYVLAAPTMTAIPTHLLLRVRQAKRVVLRVPMLRDRLQPRIELGRPGDAALHDANGDSIVLPRWDLVDLQREYGIVGVRAQLARSLPESYRISRAAIARGGTDLVRRGDTWTLGGRAADNARPLQVNGVIVPPGASVPLGPADEIADGTWRCRLAPDAHALHPMLARRRPR